MGGHIRSIYSMRHIYAADRFTKLAYNIENSPDISALNMEHNAYVTAAILSSVAFLEALINENFSDICDDKLASCGQSSVKLDEKMRDQITKTWKIMKNKRFSILDKYNLLLGLAGKKQFNDSDSSYQEVKLLIGLRNKIVHYEPEWIEIDNFEKPHDIEKKLKGKFEINKLMKNAKNPFYPDKCLGYGCAKWAVLTSLKFSKEYGQRISIAEHYIESLNNYLNNIDKRIV